MLTPFTFDINYQLAIAGSLLKDTTHVVHFNVDRVPALPIDTTKFEVERWDRSLAFRFNGGVISAITDHMDSVELRFGFAPGTANYAYDTVQVQLATTAGPQTDSEFYTLTRVGATDTFSVTFKATPAAAQVRGDGVLQYALPNDTIVATFRNHETPRLPLDTLNVRCPFHTDSLIAIGIFNAATGVQADTVRMITNASVNFAVEGQWLSLPGKWVSINGLWSQTRNPDSLQFATPLPSAAAATWTCSPQTPGSALVSVAAYGKSATVPLIVAATAPDSLRLVLLTSPDSCYAGKPIKIAASIFNAHRPVAGTTVQTCRYHDFLNDSLRPAFLPWLTINGVSTDSLDHTVQETFVNGIDTISLVLYYAPPAQTDSLHKIQLTMNSVLQDTTISFRLKPWLIDSLEIEDSNGIRLDSVVLSQVNPGDSLRARGLDRYGNPIAYDTTAAGLALNATVWSVDGSLPSPPMANGADIYYATAPARVLESGNMWATLITDSATVRVSIPVKVLPSLPLLTSAITRDYIGDGFNATDGLIDEIDLYFNKPISILPANAVYFSAVFKGDTLKIDSISPINDSSYALHIHDGYSNLSVPQTSWRPTVSVKGLPTGVDASVQAADGCAPVVWQVIKRANGPDHHKDVVEVDFSEPIRNRSGGSFSATSNPVFQTLTAWRDTGAAFAAIDSMFTGISHFDINQADSVLFFTMLNGANLTDTDYVNIRTPNPPLQDQGGNVPPANNHRVRVTITGNAIGLSAFPNPSRGTFNEVNGGTITLANQPQAQQWVQSDNAGFVMLLQGIKPYQGAGIRASLKIYDIIGNLVNYAQTNNLLSNTDTTGSSKLYDISVYWNGANHRGTLVSPGIYRAIIDIVYPSNNLDFKNARLVKTLGVK
jgi:hypothetical protein